MGARTAPSPSEDRAVPPTDGPPADRPAGDEDDPVEVLLVEEISIDGMCGVY